MLRTLPFCAFGAKPVSCELQRAFGAIKCFLKHFIGVQYESDRISGLMKGGTSVKPKRIALIPAYEPDARLTVLAKEMADRGFLVLIVDDGSGPVYQPVFKAAGNTATVLTHEKNRGKGAALKTALAWIQENLDAPYTVVTMDADGQHLPEDAERICAAAEAEPEELILGGRRFAGRVPLRSRFGNGVTRLVFRLSTGAKVHDTQTGLRAFSHRLLGELREVKGERYEYEMNVLLRWAREKRPLRELPIQTVYLDGNRSSHFRALRDSVRIYREILRFSASSFLSFLLDYGLFCLLSLLTGRVVVSNVAARLISGSVNYTVNRKLVFESRAGVGTSLLQYAVLAAGILGVNTLSLWLLVTGLGLNRYLAKILVETALFAASYLVQKRWIFRVKEAA